MAQNKTALIYILELEHNKYYIGKTYDEHIDITNIPLTLNDITQVSIEWYNIHKPIRIIDYIQQTDIFDITRIVLKYMAKYGIDNVRGGCFTDVILPYSDYIVLRKMIRELTEHCLYCNSESHTYKECPHVPISGRIEKKERTYNFTIITKDENGKLFTSLASSHDCQPI